MVVKPMCMSWLPKPIAIKDTVELMLLWLRNPWEGVEIGVKEDKLGIRSSDTHSIIYTDVKVPKENRLGADGFGFKFAMETLEGGRIGIAAQALGIAAGAYELAVEYALLRKALVSQLLNTKVLLLN